MKLKLFIALAALVAYSGARAELDREYWSNLGSCAGLYDSGDSQNDTNGRARVEEKARKERQNLDSNDTFMAGYLFGQQEMFWQLFINTQRDYHPDEDSEGFRRWAIEKAGCRTIY